MKWTRAIRPVDLQKDIDAQLLVVHKCGACAAQCLSDCQSCVFDREAVPLGVDHLVVS